MFVVGLRAFFSEEIAYFRAREDAVQAVSHCWRQVSHFDLSSFPSNLDDALSPPFSFSGYDTGVAVTPIVCTKSNRASRNPIQYVFPCGYKRQKTDKRQ